MRVAFSLKSRKRISSLWNAEEERFEDANDVQYHPRKSRAKEALSLEYSETKSTQKQREANLLAEGKRYVEAIQRLDEALELTPHKAVLFEMKAQIQLELDQFFLALESATKATQLAPEWSSGYLTLARAQINLGEIFIAQKSLLIAREKVRNVLTSNQKEKEKPDEEDEEEKQRREREGNQKKENEQNRIEAEAEAEEIERELTYVHQLLEKKKHLEAKGNKVLRSLVITPEVRDEAEKQHGRKKDKEGEAVNGEQRVTVIDESRNVQSWLTKSTTKSRERGLSEDGEGIKDNNTAKEHENLRRMWGELE